MELLRNAQRRLLKKDRRLLKKQRENLFLKQRKRISDIRTKQKRKSKITGQKYSAMRREFCRRKKLWTRKWKLSKRRKLSLERMSRFLQIKLQKLKKQSKKSLKNSSVFPDLP